MPQVKLKQGVKSSINNNAGVLNAGTLAVTTDTNELFITHNDGTVHQLCNPVIGGRNLIPINTSVWETGSISSSTGDNAITTTRLRTIEYINAESNQDYYLSIYSDHKIGFLAYDESGAYIGYLGNQVWTTGSGLLKTPLNTARLRFVLAKNDDSTIDLSDLSYVKIKLEKGNIATDLTPAPEDKADVDHDHDSDYLGIDATAADSDKLDGKHASEFATSLQGTTADNALQGIEIDSIPVEPSQSRIVNILPMSGATSSNDGLSGTVPKPFAGQQDTFLRGDGTFGLPNADVVASASYVGWANPQLNGMTSCLVNGNNVEIILSNAYVAREAFPGAVDIVRVMRNGLDLAEGHDFSIEEGIADAKDKITLIDYPLHNDDDIILVRYKTSIGVYGSVFQETIDNAILIINEVADREILLSESEYELLVLNDAVDLTKKYLIYEDDN